MTREEWWAYIVLLGVSILYLFKAFGGVIILTLTITQSVWFLLLLPLWPLDMFLLKKVLNYADKKWGAGG